MEELAPNYPEACGDNIKSTHNLDVKEIAKRLQSDYDLIYTCLLYTSDAADE